MRIRTASTSKIISLTIRTSICKSKKPLRITIVRNKGNKYILMGSPKGAQNYSQRINITKQILHDNLYQKFVEIKPKFWSKIVVSILLGTGAVSSPACYWRSQNFGIEKKFIKGNNGHKFNKPAVKICVYSSFFLGGPNAIINGILKSVPSPPRGGGV